MIGQVQEINNQKVIVPLSDVTPVDVVESGNANSVTSNAVYDTIYTSPTIQTLIDDNDAKIVYEVFGKLILFLCNVKRACNKTIPITPLEVTSSLATCCLLQYGGDTYGEIYFSNGNIIVSATGTGSGQIVSFLK